MNAKFKLSDSNLTQVTSVSAKDENPFARSLSFLGKNKIVLSKKS